MGAINTAIYVHTYTNQQGLANKNPDHIMTD